MPDAGADLPDHEVSLANQLLNVAYGNHAHHNDETHLAGDIAASEDRKWRKRWICMVQLAPSRYNVPKGRVGHSFLIILTNVFRDARERRWNAERPLVFVAVVLQKTTGVQKSGDI